MSTPTIALIIPTLTMIFAVYNTALLLLHGKRFQDKLIIFDQTQESGRTLVIGQE
jgi:hypothetical protein